MIENYKQKMLKMYRKTQSVTTKTSEPVLHNENSNGYLIGIVTAIRELYPVKNAKVTVFEGDFENMNVIDTSFTDLSGRTKTFVLPAPSKELSLEKSNTVKPFATYNMLVEADGYIKNIHLNIPIFENITSLQQSNLMPEETAGFDKGPLIFDENQKYNL